MSLQAKIVDAVSAMPGEFTADDVVDALWRHESLQDLTEEQLKREVSVRLCNMSRPPVIEKVGEGRHKRMRWNVYRKPS